MPMATNKKDLSGLKQVWTMPQKETPLSYFMNHNVWHVGFREREGILIIGLSNQILLSDDTCHQFIPDDTYEELFATVIQILIPDEKFVSCRIFAYPKYFWQPDYNFIYLENDKAKLKDSFNRYGIDPDSTADYIFVSNNPKTHEHHLIQERSRQMDKFIKIYMSGKAQKYEEARQILRHLLDKYEPLLWALDGTLFIATRQQTKADIKLMLEHVAAQNNLKLPLYDHKMQTVI